MDLTINKVAAVLVGLAMVAGLVGAFSATQAHAAEFTLSELVELFIGLGIIDDEKADEARAAVDGMDEGEDAPSMSCNFTRNLTTGDTGADVMDLQKLLNANGFTVSASGAGSAGMETEYFGPATAGAVAAMQEAFAAEILTPLGLTAGTGYFGASTRAVANGLCDDDMPDAPDMDDDDEDMDDDDDSELGGEASLDKFEIDDADESDVEEGEEEVEVAVITVEFDDGDAEITRIDLAFTDAEGTDSDAWDVFEAFSLWVDGDMVAEEAADDKDDYLGDEDDGVIRFSGLDIVGMEDEELEIVVGATINNNLDAAELGDWNVDGVSMRFFDADGVATTEDGAPVTDDTATFSIEVEGANDALDLRSSSADPDESIIALDEDNNTEEAIFVFSLDADDSDGDITLEEITVQFGLASTTRTLSEVMDDAYIEIDGERFDAQDYDGSAQAEDVDFDIDGDFVIEAGEEVDVVVYVEFEDMNEDSALQGILFRASTTKAKIEAEGDSGETVTVDGSDQAGNWHELRSQGLAIMNVEIDTDETTKNVGSSDRDILEVTFVFEATAFGEDFYMDEDIDVVNYRVVVDGSDAPAASSSATISIDGEAEDGATADKEIGNGDTAVITFVVETDQSVTGSVEVVIDSVDYSAADDNTEEENVLASPEDEWTSAPKLIN
jgi:hypothetical protein